MFDLVVDEGLLWLGKDGGLEPKVQSWGLMVLLQVQHSDGSSVPGLATPAPCSIAWARLGGPVGPNF